MSEQRLIDVDALKEKEQYIPCGNGLLFHGVTAATIDAMPVVDARPVVHAKWEHDHTDMVGGNFAVVRCSACGYKAYAIADHIRNGNFCPNCGAQMDGGGENL